MEYKAYGTGGRGAVSVPIGGVRGVTIPGWRREDFIVPNDETDTKGDGGESKTDTDK